MTIRQFVLRDEPTESLKRVAKIIPFRTREQFNEEQLQRAIHEQETQKTPPRPEYSQLFVEALNILDTLATLFRNTGHWTPGMEQHMMNIAIYVQGICQTIAGVHDGKTEGQQEQTESATNAGSASGIATDSHGSHDGPESL